VISREDMVEQSVTDFVREALVTRGYPNTQVEFVEGYPYGRKTLDRNLVCAGFNFDDEGEQAELGSDLKRRIYTIQFIIFGTTNTYARNLANVIKFAIDGEGSVPLKDISQDPPVEVDRLIVIGANAQREVVTDPEPFEQFVWTATGHFEDTYYASLV
jgi:hypothetical protein